MTSKVVYDLINRGPKWINLKLYIFALVIALLFFLFGYTLTAILITLILALKLLCNTF